MTARAERRFRHSLGAIRPYELEVPDAVIHLADNTSAFGASPSAAVAVRMASESEVVRYPSPYSGPLREAIAAYIGVRPQEVIVGCGSDDILDCALRTFASPGETVAHIAPTFVMARVFSITNALQPVAVPLTRGFDVDVDGVLGVEAPITYLCSPNNPTGGRLAAAGIERILGGTRGVVLLDEAYAEYSGHSFAAGAPSHGRLLVLRTFSKAFGLAGLRIGYGVANAELITDLEKVRGPYKVTSVGEIAALSALRNDLTWMRRAAAETVLLRDEFRAALTAAGRGPLPSDANFVLLPVTDAAAAASALLARGIHVRAFPAVPGVGDALRISIGQRDVMARVLDALLEVA